MKNVSRGYSLGVAVLLCAGGLSAAQPEEWVPLGAGRPQSSYSWGPYTSEGTTLSERTMERYGWAVGDCFLQPHAQAMAVYDDNVFLNSGEKDSEVYSVFTPGAMLIYGSPRASYLYLDYSADFTTLQAADNDVFDGQSLTAGARYQGAKSQASLSHQYREVRDVDVQVGTRLKRKTNTTAGGLEERVGGKTSVGVVGRYADNAFEDDAYSDYRDYMAGGRVSWQMRPKTALYGQADHGWVDVDESRDAYGSAQYDEVALGIHGRPTPRLGASGQVGVQHRYFEDDSLDDITREVGTVRIDSEPLELFHAWLGLSAGLRPAINAPGYTVFDTRIEPGVSRRLFSERVVGSLSAVWGHDEYAGSAAPDEEIDPRVYDGRGDDYWGLNAGIDWWIGRYWCVGAGYSYINNDSDAEGRMVDGRATDNASYEAGRWMIRASFNR